MSFLVPPPPANLADLAQCQLLPAESVLYRTHSRLVPALGFNDRYGAGGRFHFFDNDRGATVGVLYAGETPACAIFESVFHDVPVTPSKKRFRGSRLIGRDLSMLTTAAALDLVLVEFHDPGLQALGLRPERITATTSRHYWRTVAWAKAVHAQVDWAQGLVWMSARSNTAKSYVLFEDRLAASPFADSDRLHKLDQLDGWTLVRDLGAAANIVVSCPSTVVL
ncbi:RES family NAD+ phosphorylase [Nocardioides flavescens]|uniref:RES domain-containing protein n=1 Tax=Nocardioides flavescens TaxID=2691959 RepID=A0A6L7ES87_9ACTN|nr:RES family NAD+ phosphorylase [Nocardioides flavescens]MXG88416.1 RES domain-containing protein [Nocardioides flavescens]